MKKVAIYRREIFPYSETFVYNQIKSLKSYEPIVFGIRRIKKDITFKTWILSDYHKIKALIASFLYKSKDLENNIIKERPSLIHAHFGKDGLDMLNLSKKYKIPLLVTFYGYDATQPHIWNKKQIIEANNIVSQYLAYCNFIKQKMISLGFDENKITVQHTGIDINYFKYSNKKRKNQILFTGRLVEKKGCSYLIEAMKGLRNIKLIFVGDGPLRSKLERQAKGLNIEFKGVLPVKKIKKLMEESKILVVPSVTAKKGDSEGIPAVILESMALGTPVIASIHGGIPEVIENKKNGLLVEEKDIKGLRDSINLLIKNDKLKNKIIKNASITIKNKFNIQKRTKELEKLYDLYSKKD